MIEVLVNGANGKMGQETVNAIQSQDDMQLVGQSDIDNDLAQMIAQTKPKVVVDFTNPASVKSNILTIIAGDARPVIGTTGLTDTDIEEIREIAKKRKVGIIICPNFAIGAILMMKFAADAAKYMPNVEIIEKHHEKKLDSPSGTAIKTAELIANANQKINQHKVKEQMSLHGARGGKVKNIPIHSLRIPGYVANQSVVLGSQGQTLTISHETISRESFMPGVLLAIRESVTINHCVYGLENLI